MDRPTDPTQSSQTGGHVEETPEARPLTPPTMQENYAGPIGGAEPAPPSAPPPSPSRDWESGSGFGSGSGSGSGASDGDGKGAEEIAERLKPVVAAAEGIAAKALEASTKGLGILARKLEERRRQRGG